MLGLAHLNFHIKSWVQEVACWCDRRGNDKKNDNSRDLCVCKPAADHDEKRPNIPKDDDEEALC